MSYSVYNKTVGITQPQIHTKIQDAIRYAVDLAKAQPDTVFEVLYDAPTCIATVCGKIEVTVARVNQDGY